MNPPKRWYQLSILQMLVAMAVVAMLAWLNRPVPFYVHFEIGGTKAVGHFQGWPINFRPFTWIEIPVILTPSSQSNAAVASTQRSIFHGIRLVPLLGDIVLGSLMITAAVIVVGQLGKKKVLASTT